MQIDCKLRMTVNIRWSIIFLMKRYRIYGGIMLDILLDSFSDSVKLLPFLFLTYLLMEFLEHRAGSAASDRIRTAGKFGP